MQHSLFYMALNTNTHTLSRTCILESYGKKKPRPGGSTRRLNIIDIDPDPNQESHTAGKEGVGHPLDLDRFLVLYGHCLQCFT